MVEVVWKPQPSFPFPALQFVPVRLEVGRDPVEVMVQPDEVWRVMVLVVASLTPSIISISPCVGLYILLVL